MFAAPASAQQQGPIADLFLFAAEAPVSSPETVQSFATTIPADM